MNSTSEPIPVPILAPRVASADFVKNEVLKLFDDERGEQGDWRVSGPVHTTRNCWIFKGQADSYPDGVAVKIYRHPDNPRPLKAYSSALRRYRKRMMKAGGVAVPNVLHVQMENGALIMGWIEAKSLRHVLLMQDVTAVKRARRIEQCGIWLRRFHDLSNVQPEPFNYEKMALHTQRRIDSMRQSSVDQSDGGWFRRAVTLLDEMGLSFDGQEFPYANIHGDVTTSNLLISGQTMFGLDFDARYRWPLANDICRLLVHLDVSKHFLTPRRAMEQTAGDLRDVGALKAGYGDDLFPSGPFFSYILLNEIVRRIAVRSDESASQAGSLGRRLELYRLNRRCKFLVQRIEAG